VPHFALPDERDGLDPAVRVIRERRLVVGRTDGLECRGAETVEVIEPCASRCFGADERRRLRRPVRASRCTLLGAMIGSCCRLLGRLDATGTAFLAPILHPTRIFVAFDRPNHRLGITPGRPRSFRYELASRNR